jgi:hypothetical protein
MAGLGQTYDFGAPPSAPSFDASQVGDTSVAQPLTPQQSDPHGEFSEIEVRPRSDSWSPAQKLEFYIHERDMKRQAEDLEFKRAQDEHAVTVAGEDQKNLQQHIARMGESLGDIHKQLSAAPPARQMPQQTVGTMIGEGLAGLFGGGRGFSQALAAGGEVSQQQENVRYANVRTADDAKRAVLESQADQTQREIERSQGVEETMRREKVDATQQAAEIASREKIQREKDAVEAARYEEQWKAQQAKLTEEEKRDANTARTQMDTRTQARHTAMETEANNQVTVTPELSKSYDDEVTAMNVERAEHGLPPLGYLAKGERVRAATLKETIAQHQAIVDQWDKKNTYYDTALKLHHADLMTILHSTNARFGQKLDFDKLKQAWEEAGGNDVQNLELDALGANAQATELANQADAADKRGDTTEGAKLRAEAAKAKGVAAAAAAKHTNAKVALEKGKSQLDAKPQRVAAGIAMAKLPPAGKAEFRQAFNAKYADAIKAGLIQKL